MDGKSPLLKYDALIEGNHRLVIVRVYPGCGILRPYLRLCFLAVEGDTAANTSPPSPLYDVSKGNHGDDWRYLQAAIYLREGEEHIKFVYHPTSQEAVKAFKLVEYIHRVTGT